jgi:hypothetical protein
MMIATVKRESMKAGSTSSSDDHIDHPQFADVFQISVIRAQNNIIAISQFYQSWV